MPKQGPREGSRRHMVACLPIGLARPQPTVVVVLPSPAGVGLIAVTNTSLASSRSGSEPSQPRSIFALSRPYGLRATSEQTGVCQSPELVWPLLLLQYRYLHNLTPKNLYVLKTKKESLKVTAKHLHNATPTIKKPPKGCVFYYSCLFFRPLSRIKQIIRPGCLVQMPMKKIESRPFFKPAKVQVH